MACVGALRPFRAWVSYGIVVPGRCPGLFHYAPLGRKTGAAGDAWLRLVLIEGLLWFVLF
ncbi:MAG: hypothetical protein RL069_3019 [Planctomycetota bacterium]